MDRSTDARLLFLKIDRTDRRPLYRQVYDEIRGSILDGRLRAGTRLPSTRALSIELGVSRNTVLLAFEQLATEGYLRSRVGGGSYVALALAQDHASSGCREPPVGNRSLSPLVKRLEQLEPFVSREAEETRPFQLGVPDLTGFPGRLWSRFVSRAIRHGGSDLWRYDAARGHPPLGQAITEYLRASRGVVCDPSQVLVCSGSQQALELTARVLLHADDLAWIEEPGYHGARCALLLSGARLQGIALDEHGLRLPPEPAEKPKLIYVTPSHQFPTGASLSLARRLELLQRAEEWGTWIIEDDYDSEFRYESAPIPSLQGLDKGQRVIYVGTFSKTLAPALRIGFLVLPPDLVDPFVTLRAITDQHPAVLEQAVLADFLAEGHFATHVARKRRLYAQRRAFLIQALERELGDRLRICGAQAGLHLLGLLPDGLDDRRISRRLLAHGVKASPLSDYFLGPATGQGLVLGYGGFDEQALGHAVGIIARILREPRPVF